MCVYISVKLIEFKKKTGAIQALCRLLANDKDLCHQPADGKAATCQLPVQPRVHWAGLYGRLCHLPADDKDLCIFVVCQQMAKILYSPCFFYFFLNSFNFIEFHIYIYTHTHTHTYENTFDNHTNTYTYQIISLPYGYDHPTHIHTKSKFRMQPIQLANISNDKHTVVSSIHTYIGSKFDIVHRTKSKQEGSIKRRVDSIDASFLI